MVLGIDIGGTNVKFGIIDETYNIVKKFSIKTPKDKNGDSMVLDIIAKAREIYNEFPFERIGIGTPGKLDEKNGVCIESANLPYDKTPVRKMFTDEFNMPVTIENDGTCALYGELYAGAGKECDNFVIVTIGTGIGGGIVVNKKPYKGMSNLAGEFGHMTIKYDGVKCRCGRKGCFELYASASALIDQTKTGIKQNPDSLLAKIGEDQVDGKTAFDAARKGCPVGKKIVDTYIEFLSHGIINILSSLEPQMLILVGAISNEGNNIVKPLTDKIPGIYKTMIKVSKLGNDAGIIGAACCTRFK